MPVRIELVLEGQVRLVIIISRFAPEVKIHVRAMILRCGRIVKAEEFDLIYLMAVVEVFPGEWCGWCYFRS